MEKESILTASASMGVGWEEPGRVAIHVTPSLEPLVEHDRLTEVAIVTNLSGEAVTEAERSGEKESYVNSILRCEDESACLKSHVKKGPM